MGGILKNLAAKARPLEKKSFIVWLGGMVICVYFSCLDCYVCVGLGEWELCKCAQVKGCIFFYLETLHFLHMNLLRSPFKKTL